MLLLMAGPVKEEENNSYKHLLFSIGLPVVGTEHLCP